MRPGEIMYVLCERLNMIFFLVCWVRVIEIEHGLGTCGKEQKAVFVGHVMLIQENFSVSQFRKSPLSSSSYEQK